MSKELLQKVIDKGVEGYLNELFLDVSNYYTELEDNLSEYDGDGFSNFQAIGEINFSPSEKLVVVTANIAGDLTERSGKKAQYEKAKKILKAYMRYDAGIFVFRDPAGSFRLSLVYGTPDANRLVWSNFHRFTYFVSPGLTNKTFLDRVGTCNFASLEIIRDAFSVEKVNKEFYGHIAKFFYRLTGYDCTREMTLPSVSNDDKKTYQEFAVRLIGRAIFCWFLKYKKAADGDSLIPESILSSEAVRQNPQYYHSVLEKLFFEVLNTQIKERKGDIFDNADKIPFLNGGLFEPHKDDFNEPSLINAFKIPDEWFKQFFEILEQYNFTIDENSTIDADISVDPEMLGRIFENLLAEVNPETGDTARKATGSYYTPRTIVDYMVDQSLKQYLTIKTSISEGKIASLLSYEVEDVSLTDAEHDLVISALDEIKIIDPACGSGAFPMGILHKMLLVLQKVDPDLHIWLRNHLGKIEPGIFRDRLLERIKDENWEYVRKLLIIQNSIYGVDIQTIAVDISKLRFFLSLIVDEKIEDDRENRGVEALPNLEFKFVAANSLIGLPPAINRQIGFGGGDEVDRLKELRNDYLRSYGKEKKKIEEDFRLTRGTLIEHATKWGGKDTFALQLANWDPFANEACDWFDPDWMFGIEGGFDIVIANPPYYSLEVADSFIKFYLKKSSQIYSGKADICYFFFEKGINILNSYGTLTFITSRYYIEATYANLLRKFITENSSVLSLMDFFNSSIFEQASIHNVITILSKPKNDLQTEVAVLKKLSGGSLVSPENFEVFNTQLNNANWLLAGTNESKIIEKIRSRCTKLSDLAIIEQGQKSGLNSVFCLEEKLAKSFEPGPLRKMVKNSHIGKYSINYKKLYLIYADDRFDINNYPKIKQYLLIHKDKLKSRAEAEDGLYPWYRLQRPRDEKLFLADEKIIVPYRAPSNRFAYDNQQLFNDGGDIRIIVIKPDCNVSTKYCLSILNSKLMDFYYSFIGRRKGDVYEYFVEPLSKIPIKKIDSEKQKPFVTLVDKILAITKDEDYLSNPAKQATVKELEDQIDQLVYKLYELTPEEIAVVDGKVK